MTDETTLLAVENVSAGYGDLRVLWDVSLEVGAGRVTLLVGRNGAGKTTTLRAIAGLNKTQHGRISFDGERIDSLSASDRIRRGIAYVQEGKRIFRRRTVEENLLLGGYPVSRSRRVLKQAAGEIYAMFPALDQRRNTRAGELSGGQQQMVAIGQALMAKPKLILLDEPSGGLAPAIYKDVMRSVDAVRQLGVGILLVEQAVEASMDFADDVVVLDVGRVTAAGRTDAISTQALVRDAYLGRRAADPGRDSSEAAQ